MRRTNFTLALAFAGAVPALALQSSAALAQPAGGGSPRVERIGPPEAEDIDGAREFVAIMYHGDTDDDTADWLSERLMDRYRRAFDLFDGVDDPAVRAAIAQMLNTLPARLRHIVDPRIPALRAGAIRTFATWWRGEQMRTLLAFVRTSAGKRYVEEFPMLEPGNVFLRPALAPLMRDNMALANAVIGELSARLGTRFSGNPEYAKAIVAAASGL
ncbi:MAG TPA: hypothetical protein VGF77_18405 [Allosphingosinicella sp.]